MTQQYCLASMAAWLSSTGISHLSLLPHVPSVCLFTANSRPCPVIAPHSLHSSPQLLCLLGTCITVLGTYGCSKDCLILIPFRLFHRSVPQISCFILNPKCFSSDSDNCPNVGIIPLLQFPHPPRAGPVLVTFLFFPLVPLSY